MSSDDLGFQRVTRSASPPGASATWLLPAAPPGLFHNSALRIAPVAPGWQPDAPVREEANPRWPAGLALAALLQPL